MASPRARRIQRHAAAVDRVIAVPGGRSEIAEGLRCGKGIGGETAEPVVGVHPSVV